MPLTVLFSCVVVLCNGANERIGVTSLAGLNQVVEQRGRVEVSVSIEGTVWWSNKADGRIILQDESAVVQLELNLPGRLPAFGEHIVLEGQCLGVKAGEVIKVSGVPVVDNDGVHGMGEGRPGTIHLTAGRHPIRVVWFDRTKSEGLNVEYEAVGLPRMKVPDTALFRRKTDGSGGATRYVNGLDYRYYEGRWWRMLPNFEHMVPAKTGVVSNFDISVRDRDEHVGLCFSGFIQVPTDGEYTFFLQSDDGSKLYIGEPTLRIHGIGREALPDQAALVATAGGAGQPPYQWTEVEGSVISLHRINGTLEVEVQAKTGLVKILVAEDSEDSFTLMPQNRIRAFGLSRLSRTVDRGLVRGELFVQRWDDVEQLYIAPQIWADYTRSEIGSLALLGRSNIVGSVVYLQGMVIPGGAGDSVYLEDDSGRILLDGELPENRVGQFSEVLGIVGLNGSDLVLRCLHFRMLSEGGTAADKLSVLTTAEQVCQLNREEAARGYPVRVRGVITSIMEYEGDFEGVVIQDATRGILVDTEGNRVPLEIGDYCEIEGNTSPFGFQPDIHYTHLTVLGKAMLPNPAQPSFNELINGSMHCNYVELEGVLTSVKDDMITLLTRDGRINVRLNREGVPVPASTLGATIRLRGCLIVDWDEESRQLVVGSIYLDQQKMTVVHPAPMDPFAIPLKHIGDLLQFDPQAGAFQRVRVSGLLLYQDGGKSFLGNEGNGLCFITAEPVGFKLGDRLDVVGFVDISGTSPLLRDAVVRQLGHEGRPAPRRLEAGALVNDDYDSTLVYIEGVLVGIAQRPDRIVLDMQSGLRRFNAVLNGRAGLKEMPKPGSKLGLTGVYAGLGGNRVLGQPVESFELLLDSGKDIRLLARPPWWTLKRLVLVVGILVAAVIGSLVWIKLLHQQVEQKSQQLGDQIRKRQLAERQRAIEEERARLAHDLHDDLGSGLTEVNLLALLASSPTAPEEEKQHCTEEMNRLLSRMVMSLDEIVWAENPKNDTVASLAGYFGAHAQRLLDMASVTCGLEMDEDLPDMPLDPKFRQELFMAFKEAITNIVKHAGASKVWLRVSVQENTLYVVLRDDGCGMPEVTEKAGANGLGNMRARMAALGGICEIRSTQAKGTTVCLKAPLSRTET